MTSVATATSGSAVELPPRRRENCSVGHDRTEGSAGRVEIIAGGGLAEVPPPVPLDGEGGSGETETTVGGKVDEPRVLKLENGDGEQNRVSSSVRGKQGDGKNSGNVKQVHEKSSSIVADRGSVLPDYDSFLSAFDEFAARAKGVAVGHGYYIGDMVWGKVKSHPWWPGQIYNETLASPSVRRTKHDGQVLVAFFGDNSYGWSDPAELIPFEDNFVEKSRQTTAKTFLIAVEEAVDELSRRRRLGLACRCRNDFNFWPSNVDGYFAVDVGDSEPGIYGWNQIKDARDSFQPREMFSFVEKLALKPMNWRRGDIGFIKNKATALARRKAFFEEFDETYAQAFGSVSTRPARPSAPVAVDPSKALLSRRPKMAEALGQGKVTVKSTKTEDEIEKDKYLFKRREEVFQIKRKATSFGQGTSHLLSVDGLSSADTHSSVTDHVHQACHGVIDCQHQSTSHIASTTCDMKHSADLRRHIGGEKKSTKVQKRLAELNAENATLIEKKMKRKKERNAETVGIIRKLPPAVSHSGIKAGNAPGMDNQILHMNTKLDNQKDTAVGSLSSQVRTETDFAKLELQMMVTDLCALALNPLHGIARSCPAVIRQVFLKFRSLVFQKSLVRPPPQPNAGNSIKSRPAPFSVGTAAKTTDKIVKPWVRHDDPTKGGQKRGPSDRAEVVQKKRRIEVLEEIKRKKRVDGIRDMEKKKADDSKLLPAEKKIIRRPAMMSQRGDMKGSVPKIAPAALPKTAKLEISSRPENAPKNHAAAPPKPTKLEPGSRVEHTTRVSSPTMLVMKFAAGALPSGAELKAKFARFGPLDHSATRVFWKTHTCRLVFLYEVDAQAALKFARASSSLFGNPSVRSYTRAFEAEAVESESIKIQKEDISINSTQPQDTAAVEQRMLPKPAAQPLQSPHSAQLKSCLKKPSGDEVGNGNGRGTRVKFVLGRDEKNTTDVELLTKENKNRVATSATSHGTPSAHPVESGDKIPSSFLPQNSSTSPSSDRQPTVNVPHPALAPRLVNIPVAPLPDISHRLLNLLQQCNDVVNNMTRRLGHVPYQPL